MGIRAFTVTSLVFSLLLGGLAEQCGWQANGALCPNGLCCSSWGFCGSADPWCGEGCQSQCDGGGDDDDGGDVDHLESIIPKSTFEQMLVHSNSIVCPAMGFYSYEAFIKAAKAFPDFATHGDNATRKREIAAFFGQTSFETSVIGWEHALDGPYSWGYCYIRHVGCRIRCSPSDIFPCAPGKSYCGRGPIQLTGNYNYGQCGLALGVDLLNYPELVETDPVLAFKTAIWFWMTPQFPKPSCHDVITGKWLPSARDLSEGRVPGYGVITNIINGAFECGIGTDRRGTSRIGFYKRQCDILGIDYGDNLDCFNQRPFRSRLLVDTI